MIDVDIAAEAAAALQAMSDHGDRDPPPRCHRGVIKTAIGGAVRRLLDGTLDGSVRPWHLRALRSRAAVLGDVTSAVAVHVEQGALVAELRPSGEHILFRGVDDEWRLERFVDGVDTAMRPETTRRVELPGSGPDAVLAGLGVVKPDEVTLAYSDDDLGQGETESRYGYYWTDERGRSILAEEVKNEIFDGATPYSTYLRGVIIDGDHGTLLTGRDGSALIIEG